MRIHNNDFNQCQYCPFKYIYSSDYTKHLKGHFGIKDIVCDQCGRLFRSKSRLNEHAEMHEGIIYCCLLCENFRTATKGIMSANLRKQHTKIAGKYINKEEMLKFTKIIK